MQTTTRRQPTLEELVPEDPPQPVIKANVKTARIHLKRDYWPVVKLTKGDRLYGGQTVVLPVDEARKVVENKIGDLVFDEPTDNEALK